MEDTNALFLFIDRLQAWARTELRRCRVQDLAAAIATAESLIDYSNTEEANKPGERKTNPKMEELGTKRANNDIQEDDLEEEDS